MRKGLLTAIAIFLGFFCYSQETDQTANILPPSPTASELGKYGLVPVGMATGTPNVDIPLYVYKTRNLEVPISLSYSSNGVKVDQIASWVGLNFSLNSGGVITRIIRDDPDEDNIINDVNYQYPETFSANNVEALLYLDMAKDGEGFDTEPDLFSFNFQGHTGKFIFNRDGTPLIMPHQNIIIQRIVDPGTAGLGHFLVITPDGIRYTFGAVETSKSYQFTGCGKNYDRPRESSWYLTEIRHPAGDVITFEYESNTFFYPVGVSQSARGVRQAAICPGGTATSGGTTIQTCLSKILAKTVRLVKITSSSQSSGVIEFASTKDRSDLDDYKLNSIIIKNVGQTIKTFDFAYDFSTSSGYSNAYTTEELKHRMFLTSLTEKDRLGKSVRTHSFEYEDINGLPPRLSYAQDHWGFFNGASDHSHLIPNGVLIKDVFGRYLFENIGGNREPSFPDSKKGILTRVNYPTAGYSQFDYGPNSYFGERTVFPSKTPFEIQGEISVDGPLTVIKKDSIVIPPAQLVNFRLSAGQRPGYDPDPIHARGTIVVRDLTFGGSIVLNETVRPEDGVQTGTWEIFYEDHEYSFTLTTSGEGVSAYFTFDYYASKPVQVEDNIEAGGLRISKIVNHDPNENKDEEINYYYSKHDLLSQSSGKIGSPPQYYTENYTQIPCNAGDAQHGPPPCSISEITYGVLSSNCINTLFTPAGNSVYYEYVTVSRGTDDSQGVEEHQFIINFDYAGQQVWGNNLIKDAPLTNFGWNNGLELYSRFYKKTENGFDLLKQTFNEYITDSRNYKEVNALVVRKKYEPACYGELIITCDGSNVEKEYKAYRCVTNHNHHWLIGGYPIFGNGQTICNAPDAVNRLETYWYHPCWQKPLNSTIPQPRELDHVDAIEYKNIAYWFYLKQKIETLYENNVEKLKTVTEYVYDNPLHAQRTREQVIGSDGKQNETIIKYPDDYDAAGNISTLKEKHIVSIPIKKESTVSGNQIGGSVILYNDFGQPKEVHNYETAELKPPVAHSSAQIIPSSDYKPKFEYAYDAITNLVKEIIPTNSTKKSYVWGYDNSLPIAEVLNASSNEILFKGFEDENGTLENENNLARTGHKYWNSGSYDFLINSNFTPGGSALQMSYWYWENGQWVFSEILDFNNTINQGTRLDDIRVFPKSSQMVTYTYDPLIGVTSITDSNNITTYYEYDALGRLETIKDSDQNIVKRYKYHYQNEQ